MSSHHLLSPEECRNRDKHDSKGGATAEPTDHILESTPFAGGEIDLDQFPQAKYLFGDRPEREPGAGAQASQRAAVDRLQDAVTHGTRRCVWSPSAIV